eukprot:scaffold1436_cov250-Pinguiococcus_pyrenoidosus.AAC.13
MESGRRFSERRPNASENSLTGVLGWRKRGYGEVDASRRSAYAARRATLASLASRQGCLLAKRGCLLAKRGARRRQESRVLTWRRRRKHLLG